MGKFRPFGKAPIRVRDFYLCEAGQFRIRGAVAEWLRRGLQSLAHRFDSGPRLHRLDICLAFDPA